MRLSSSMTAKVAAAFLTATSPMVGSFSASAQQMATNTSASSAPAPDFSACDQLARSKPAAAVQCRVDVLKSDSARFRQESASARVEIECTGKIKAEIAAGKISAADLRTAIAGRPADQVNTCDLLKVLSRS